MAEEVSVTLKENKGPDSTWVVVRGTVAEVRKALAEMFQLDGIEEWTFNAVVSAAQSQFRAVNNTVNALGGRVIDSGRASVPTTQGSESNPAPWEGTKAESSDVPSLVDVIAAAESMDALKAIHQANKAQWKPEHTAAVKARRAGLTKAAA